MVLIDLYERRETDVGAIYQLPAQYLLILELF